MKIEKIEKVKSDILVSIGNNKTYRISLADRCVYGLKGNKIQRNPFVSCDLDFDNAELMEHMTAELAEHMLRYMTLFHCWNKQGKNNAWELSREEAFFSCLDLVNPEIYRPANCSLPKGFVQWARKNNKIIDSYSLTEYKEFETKKRVAQLPLTAKEKSLVEYVNRRSYPLDSIGFAVAKMDNLKLVRLVSEICQNSFAHFELDINVLLYDYADKSNIALLDPTKTASVNAKILEEARNKHRNERILKQEAKILSLADVDFGEYVVVVPTDMEQFTDEGNQQHNCVGYNYHASMASGQTWIYFLRKKDNPEKSFITCQFSPFNSANSGSCSWTHQARTIYNGGVTDEERDFIHNTIDPIIREILGLKK